MRGGGGGGGGGGGLKRIQEGDEKEERWVVKTKRRPFLVFIPVGKEEGGRWTQSPFLSVVLSLHKHTQDGTHIHTQECSHTTIEGLCWTVTEAGS